MFFFLKCSVTFIADLMEHPPPEKFDPFFFSSVYRKIISGKFETILKAHFAQQRLWSWSHFCPALSEDIKVCSSLDVLVGSFCDLLDESLGVILFGHALLRMLITVLNAFTLYG